jgi:hypothetical protein
MSIRVSGWRDYAFLRKIVFGFLGMINDCLRFMNHPRLALAIAV